MDFDLNHGLAIIGLTFLGVAGLVSSNCDPNIIWGAMTAIAGIAGFGLGAKKATPGA